MRGPRQRYCKECAKTVVNEHVKAHKRDYMAETENVEKSKKLKAETLGKRYVCPICGREFEKHTSTDTCSPECAKEMSRRTQNRADIKRGRRKLPEDQRYESGLPKSGIVGVTYHRQSGKWHLQVKGKYIGVYDTIDQAKDAKDNLDSIV